MGSPEGVRYLGLTRHLRERGQMTPRQISSRTPGLASDPVTLAASLPHLLGFHPSRSLVVLWFREGMLTVTQRADLPCRDDDDRADVDPDAFARAFVAAAGHVCADAAVGIFVDGSDDIVQSIHERLKEQIAVPCHGIFQIRGSRITELGNPVATWHWIDARARESAAAKFRNSQPELSRACVEGECAWKASDEQALRVSWMTGSQSVEEFARRVTAADGTNADVVDAALIRAVAAGDVGRDLMLRWAADQDPADVRPLLHEALRAVRAMPPGTGANVAAIACVLAWLCGDGVRANVAVDRCLSDDPDHRLGGLLNRALAAGIHPDTVRETLRSPGPEMSDA